MLYLSCLAKVSTWRALTFQMPIIPCQWLKLIKSLFFFSFFDKKKLNFYALPKAFSLSQEYSQDFELCLLISKHRSMKSWDSWMTLLFVDISINNVKLQSRT